MFDYSLQLLFILSNLTILGCACAGFRQRIMVEVTKSRNSFQNAVSGINSKGDKCYLFQQ